MTGRNLRRIIGIAILVLAVFACFCGCGKKNQADSYEQALSEDVQNKEIAEDAIESSRDKVEDLEQVKEELELVARPKVKGIFVTGPMAGTSNMEQLIELVDETELNAIVMDIKNDEGRITYDMQIPAVQEIGAGIRYIQDMEALMNVRKKIFI